MDESLLGSLFGLSCAVVWSITVLLFKNVTRSLNPNMFNLIKNTIALMALAFTILVLDGQFFFRVARQDFLNLFFSGLIGLGIADLLFLYCLKKVGAGWTAVVETSYTPFVFLFSLVLLSESISQQEAFGAVIIVGALFFVSFEKSFDKNVSKTDFGLGIAAGIASLFLVAFGVVLTKLSLDSVPLLHAVEIRLLGGVIMPLVILLARPNRIKKDLMQVLEYPNKAKLFWISMVGTYLTLILWVAGFKFQKATITAVLNQTSTVFTLIASAMIFKEKITRTKLWISGLAIIGVIITIF